MIPENPVNLAEFLHFILLNTFAKFISFSWENYTNNVLIAKKQGIFQMLSIINTNLCSGYFFIFLSTSFITALVIK